MTNIFSKFFNKNNNFYDEASERKRRSEAILKGVNIPINKWLPVIETEVEAKFRKPVEVAKRAMALCLVSLKGGGEEQAEITGFLQKLNLEDHLSSDEHNFIYNDNPSAREKVQFSWKYECYWVMLWALGYIDNLGLPDHICDVPIAVKTLINKTDKEFIDNIKFRSKKEILDYADLIYRIHWAVREAQINNEPIPGNMNSGVVVERHYAFNWLIGYMEQDWDDVTTDT